jgi:hypothetical protein
MEQSIPVTAQEVDACLPSILMEQKSGTMISLVHLAFHLSVPMAQSMPPQ